MINNQVVGLDVIIAVDVTHYGVPPEELVEFTVGGEEQKSFREKLRCIWCN